LKGVWAYFILDDFIIVTPTTRVIGFGTHNQGCGGENGTSEASSKKAQNGPCTHVIDYQTLTAYKNW